MFRSAHSTAFEYCFIAKEKQECAIAAFHVHSSLCKISKIIVALLPYEIPLTVMALDNLGNVWWISEESAIVSIVFIGASYVLQGPGGAEEVLSPDPPQSQQPRVHHSFVQEHFQAQYKWVYFFTLL